MSGGEGFISRSSSNFKCSESDANQHKTVAVVSIATAKWVVNSTQVAVIEASAAVAVETLATAKWMANNRQLVVEESPAAAVKMLVVAR